MRASKVLPVALLAQLAIALSVSCDGQAAHTDSASFDAGKDVAGGSSGTAGSSGTGGCHRDDAGNLPVEAKACATDDDCTAVPTYSCCGPGLIVGLARRVPQYLTCLQTTEPANCPPLGCASRAQTEDGRYPPGAPFDLTGVGARCIASDVGRLECATYYDPEVGDAASDGMGCFPLFHPCSTDHECCVPNRCLTITTQPLCQQEGPTLDGGR